MTAASKIQRAPRVREQKDSGKRRLDGKAPSQRPQKACAYAKCGVSFSPAKHNQVYHSEACRKRASFDRKFLRLDDDPNRVLQESEVVLLYCTVLVAKVDTIVVGMRTMSGTIEAVAVRREDLVIPAKEK